MWKTFSKQKQFHLKKIQFSVSSQFKCQNIFISAIQLSISTQFGSIWPIHRTRSGATSPCQSRPGSDGNGVVLFISISSSITKTSPSDCFMLYTGYSLRGRSYPSAEKQSVYSTAPADWAIFYILTVLKIFLQNCAC